MELEALAEAIGHLVATGPSSCADGESMATLEVLCSRLDAFRSEAMAGFEASGQWADDGAQTAAAWLAARGRLAKGRTFRLARHGRALRSLPACRAAFGAGELSADHLEAVCQVWNPRTEEALFRDEGLLVAQARTLSFREFRRALSYWVQLADADGTDDRSERDRTKRKVSLTEGFDGIWHGQMTLDPVSGAIVTDELARIEHQLYEADQAEARARLGKEPTKADLLRTDANRMADAVVEMAARSASCPAGARRPRPLFTVHVDFETFRGRICELANGQVVAPATLVPWLTEADIERAVFSPPNRVDISATTRLFTGATRRALEVRDRECTHPYCDRPADRCQADHIQEHRNGGETTQQNGRILCGFHNRLRNHERPPPEDDPG